MSWNPFMMGWRISQFCSKLIIEEAVERRGDGWNLGLVKV
jgi:hypothetical protein